MIEYLPLLLSLARPWLSNAQTSQDLIELPSQGLVTDTYLVGIIGTTYHSIRYEPLCGTLGTEEGLYNMAWDVGDRCRTALSAHASSEYTAGIYDQAGVRLEGEVVRHQPVCICMSLADATERTRGEVCVFANDQGQAEQMWYFSGPNPGGLYVASAFQPKATKALPQCANVDIAALSSAWSATAITSSPTSSLGSPKKTIQSIQTSISVSTDAEGRPVATETFLIPTSIVVKDKGPDDTGPLSRSDKIALGVGLGVGLPSVVLAVVGAWAKMKRDRRIARASLRY